jgi:hypothetical protein
MPPFFFWMKKVMLLTYQPAPQDPVWTFEMPPLFFWMN